MSQSRLRKVTSMLSRCGIFYCFDQHPLNFTYLLCTLQGLKCESRMLCNRSYVFIPVNSVFGLYQAPSPEATCLAFSHQWLVSHRLCVSCYVVMSDVH